MLAMVAARGAKRASATHKLRSALFCGEPLPMAYANDFRQFVDEGQPIWNLYGPTEATISFTCKPVDFEYDMSKTVPLGSPFGQNRIAVEHEDGTITDLTEGCEGELLLSGPQVFSG
jgi:D-alanine--poly(phosphoribitol) ligase subunit 1